MIAVWHRAPVSTAAVLLLAACAGPPLTLYTLAGSLPAVPDDNLHGKPVVIAVARVAVPDELDSEDLVVRDGNILRRSATGRWATRLSLGITDRLTARLSAHWRDAVVTDRPLSETVSYRVLVNISRLDVDSAGVAVLAADWQIIPVDSARSVTLSRTQFSLSGPVARDQGIVSLVGQMTDRLADAIDAPGARPGQGTGP